MVRGIGNITQEGAPVLRTKASTVKIADIHEKPMQNVIKRMKEELSRHDDGVAIAAPQIGEPLRIFVVSRKVFALTKDGKLPDDEEMPETTKNLQDLVCINPRIVKLSKKRRWVPEGCLSVRWKYGETHRAEKATIEAYDETGKMFVRGGSGLLAQIFQHETDHLDGILFIDHARHIEEIVPEEFLPDEVEEVTKEILTTMRFVFFGTPEFSAIILDELKHGGFVPSLVVTAPDKPKGRHLVLRESEVNSWAKKEGVPVITPEKIDEECLSMLSKEPYDLFIVAAYGKILPQKLLDLPQHGTLNVHPSLLPKFRGSSPIESAILSDETETGVSIMLLDAQMDHGPILAQKVVSLPSWPPKGTILTNLLAHEGGKLLADCLEPWTSGTLKAIEQDHGRATFTKKMKKEDGEVDLADDPLKVYRKIQAYDGWPGTYFFVTRKDGTRIRVRITEATYAQGVLTILRVIPEGKKEMGYEDLLRGLKG